MFSELFRKRQPIGSRNVLGENFSGLMTLRFKLIEIMRSLMFIVVYDLRLLYFPLLFLS